MAFVNSAMVVFLLSCGSVAVAVLSLRIESPVGLVKLPGMTFEPNPIPVAGILAKMKSSIEFGFSGRQ